MTKEIENNMQYLIHELHKEWDKSGEIVKNIGISLDKSQILRGALIEKIMENRKASEDENISFKKSIKLSKESFLYLRMYRKALESEEKTIAEEDGEMFFYPLDKEELQVYREIFTR